MPGRLLSTDSIDAMRAILPDKPRHHRVFRYNAACALFRLKKLDMAEREARQVVAEPEADVQSRIFQSHIPLLS